MLGVLDEEGVEYVVTDETSSRDVETVVSFPLPTPAVEPVLDSLQEEQISRQEPVTRADELTPTFVVFLAMTLISSLVATAGLLLDSPAVVVG